MQSKHFKSSPPFRRPLFAFVENIYFSGQGPAHLDSGAIHEQKLTAKFTAGSTKKHSKISAAKRNDFIVIGKHDELHK